MNYSDRPDNLIDYPTHSDGTPSTPPTLSNEQVKQAVMEEMLAASPSVWRNVIITNNTDGAQFEFEIGNISSVETGVISTTTSNISVSASSDSTSWVVTTFQELGADQPTEPDPVDRAFERGREFLFGDAPDPPGWEEPIAPIDSTEEGVFESASPLRDEGDTDTMGLEQDPGSVIAGSAEAWFRNLRGMDGPEAEVGGFCSQAEQPCAPGCELHVQDEAACDDPCCDPSHWNRGVHTRPADEGCSLCRDNPCPHDTEAVPF